MRNNCCYLEQIVETDASQVTAVYEERRRRFAAEAAVMARRSRRIADARLGAFLLFALGFLAPVLGAPEGLSWGLAVGALAAFGGLVALHHRVDQKRYRAEDGCRLNQEALSRLAREWDNVPEPRRAGSGAPDFARDLDVFGHASLWKLLGTVSTPPGRTVLERWLRSPATGAEIGRRQPAVRELAPRLDFRQELQLRARAMGKLDPDCDRFLHWAEGDRWLATRTALRWFARVSPALVLALIGLAAAGLVPHHLWLLLALVDLVVAYRVSGEIHGIFGRVSNGEGEFRNYARVIDLLVADDNLATAGGLVTRLRGELSADPERPGSGAARQLARLNRLVTLSDTRFAMVHGLLQALLLWDLQVLDRMEKWQLEAGPRARQWLTAIGEIEALCALAGLAFDQPEWCYPEVLADAGGEERRLEARQLGHPLIAAGARVHNDVTVGPPGTFLLVTGSNMSGKSTLIRALGLNAVLAQSGGPACANRLRLPPVDLGTSVLIEDSLEDGVSFFMAELQRVKAIVDLAEDSRRRGRTLLYLMDEILRGTNTVERQAAVRRVLIHLLRAGAIGAIASHDLTLAELDGLAEACRPVHFRETLEGEAGRPAMTFDYRLRPGVATTRNALKLLELVGLKPEGTV